MVSYTLSRTVKLLGVRRRGYGWSWRVEVSHAHRARPGTSSPTVVPHRAPSTLLVESACTWHLRNTQRHVAGEPRYGVSRALIGRPVLIYASLLICAFVRYVRGLGRTPSGLHGLRGLGLRAVAGCSSSSSRHFFALALLRYGRHGFRRFDFIETPFFFCKLAFVKFELPQWLPRCGTRAAT